MARFWTARQFELAGRVTRADGKPHSSPVTRLPAGIRRWLFGLHGATTILKMHGVEWEWSFAVRWAPRCCGGGVLRVPMLDLRAWVGQEPRAALGLLTGDISRRDVMEHWGMTGEEFETCLGALCRRPERSMERCIRALVFEACELPVPKWCIAALEAE